MKLKVISIFVLFTILLSGRNMGNDKKYKTATFASGCFWCTEAVFERIEGVVKVISGYTGGHTPNPSYEDVCTGTTGHAEAIQLQYDPDKISYVKLLEVFFSTHDPTTLNRQGADVGTQYRSAIFYHSEDQKKAAEEVIAKLTEEKIFPDPIVTEVKPASTFYEAELYHQNYYDNNKSQPYCSFVITPKIKKFEKVFKDLLKKE